MAEKFFKQFVTVYSSVLILASLVNVVFSVSEVCPSQQSESRRPNPFIAGKGFEAAVTIEGSFTFDRNCTYRSSILNHTQENGTPTNNTVPGTRELALSLYKGVLPSLPMLPPFAPDTATTNELCRNHSKIFLKEVKDLKMWALKMYDASAKFPSGLLHGNVNQYGDFDQCIHIDEMLMKTQYDLEDHHLLGKYCLAHIQIISKALTKNSDLMGRLQSYYMIRSNVSDPGHRLPRFSSVNWAFCIPSSCSYKDLQNSVEDILESHTAGYEISLSVNVDPKLCYTKHSWKGTIDFPTIVCFVLLVVLILVTLLATAIDGRTSPGMKINEQTWDVLRSFSLRKNTEQLFSLSVPVDDICCLHGIRFLNALALLLSHKSIALFFNPFVNRTSMAEGLSYRWTVIARTAIIYTDAFIMLSGILTAYSFIQDLDKRKKLNVMKKYILRFIRLSPNFFSVILLCTYILVPLGTGPQWNLVVKHHSDLCKSYMWRNILYIHNYFGFEDMCLTHTHQLGIDMQLFLFSPLIVFLLWKWTEVGFITCIALGFFSTALRYLATYNLHLSPLVYFGASITQLFSTATNSYILPTHRLTSYLFGIGMGVYLRRMEKDITLNKFQVFFGWLISLSMGVWAMMGPTQVTSIDYVYKVHEQAFYMAFSPIFWCIFIGWVIFATVNGYGGFFGDFLSWKGFIVFTRMAYALYLIQFPIFFYNVGRKRSAEFYDLGVLFNILELSIVVLASAVLTLFIDLPSQNLRKIYFSEARTGKKDSVHPDVKAMNIEKRAISDASNGPEFRRRAAG